MVYKLIHMVFSTEYSPRHRRAVPPRFERLATAQCPRCVQFVGAIEKRLIPVQSGRCSVPHIREDVDGVPCYAVTLIHCKICEAEVPITITVH